MPGTRDYWSRIQRIYETDIGRAHEFAIRNCLVVIVALAVGFGAGLAAAFWWVVFYEAIVISYYIFMTRLRAPGSRRAYRIAIAFNIAGTVFFTVLPLYLWTFPDIALKFVAACGIFGMAMLNLTRHTFEPNVARVDMTMVSLSILFMGFFWMSTLGFGTQSILIGLGSVCSAGYYAFAHLDGLKLRTRVLDNERRAGESAKMQAVGQLTTGIAHDFNNILTVVLGNIELARLAENPAEADESLQEAHRAAERAASLVAQLLAFSRRAQLNPVPLDPRDVINSFTRTMQRVLPASISLRHHIAPDMPRILCDRTSLDTALLNLVINARDAMSGRGEVTIEIDRMVLANPQIMGHSELAPGAYGRIAVRDTGPGIPDDQINRVAEPFFTTKSIGQGSGLGLAMVKGFSEQSGGAMVLSSSPRGTEVALLLPLAPRPARA